MFRPVHQMGTNWPSLTAGLWSSDLEAVSSKESASQQSSSLDSHRSQLWTTFNDITDGIDIRTWCALIISTNHIARPTDTQTHTQTDTQTDTHTDRHRRTDMMCSHHLHKSHSPSYRHTDRQTDVWTWCTLIISTNDIARPTSTQTQTHRHRQTYRHRQTHRQA